MDSINHSDKQQDIDDMVAPGADDNGSGVVVLLEVLRALAPLFAEKHVVNEVQFHWYAAEEIGLHGSDSVFAQYQNQSWPVKAMLNLDMVGYRGDRDEELPTIAVQGDHIDENLKAFTKKLIGTYPNATAGDMACGYPCSDHASAFKYGFPSAMIGESAYINSQAGRPNGYPWIHSANDTIDHIDFEYMLEFAKVAAGFIVELAYTNFSTLG
ncbi:Zn-dependent exopeptidase [Cryphonectria parasitica EP155]|uniref:Peptide hydrolase n=1 Tax=Cryphonectria parasitica (strain ATCC 38755 / EP155) TaxID=660469 RepID=A0A9P4Y6W4_CRYP1|nr:Zn-dependent exopeptidase [Cryphonectria parasitica EP155]KAF3767549.1 Zn-dependent exopeptidase [Cryphonectria parasitica EP155]